MTTPPFLPDLRGLGWSPKKSPMHSTTIAPHVSGREVRQRNYAQTLYQFELVYEGLASSAAYPGLGADSLQTLMDFFIAAAGSFGTWLYTDPTDCRGTGQPLGTGDGTTATFRFQRAQYNKTEPVGWVSYVSAVYLNGTPQVGNWTLAEPTAAVPYPNLTFTSAPAVGVVVTSDFNWSFVCRFSDDTLEFEQFMSNLWSQSGMKFQSVRNGGF